MFKHFSMFCKVLAGLAVLVGVSNAVAQTLPDTDKVKLVTVYEKTFSDSIRIVNNDGVKRVEFFNKTTETVVKTIDISGEFINTKISKNDYTSKILDKRLSDIVKNAIADNKYYNLEKHIYYPMRPQIKNNYLSVYQYVSYRLKNSIDSSKNYSEPILEESILCLYNAQGEIIFTSKDGSGPSFSKTGKYFGYCTKQREKYVLFDIQSNKNIEIYKAFDEIVFSKNDIFILLVGYMKGKNDYELSIYDSENNKWKLENFKYTPEFSPSFKTVSIIEQDNILI